MTAARAAAAAGLAMFAALAPPAAAQERGLACMPRDAMIRALESQYGERLRVQAPTGDGLLLEIFVRDDDATWTATRRGRFASCVLATGSDWTEQRRGAPGRDG